MQGWSSLLEYHQQRGFLFLFQKLAGPDGPHSEHEPHSELTQIFRPLRRVSFYFPWVLPHVFSFCWVKFGAQVFDYYCYLCYQRGEMRQR